MKTYQLTHTERVSLLNLRKGIYRWLDDEFHKKAKKENRPLTNNELEELQYFSNSIDNLTILTNAGL